MHDISNKLTEDFIEAWDETDVLLSELLFSLSEYPHQLFVSLNAAHVGVGSEENMLDLRLFLIDFLNWLVH